MATKAFEDGYQDGSDWDLDGFDSMDDAAKQATGWDEATINAMGASYCAKRWGVEEGADGFRAACSEYNSGVATAIRERVASSR